MLKDPFDIIIYFGSKRSQVSKISENKEILYYVINGIHWNQNKVNVDNVFAYNVAINVINDNENQEPKSIKGCRQRNNWSQ